MSIYATLWCLKFPRFGDDLTGRAVVFVTAGTPEGTPRSPQEYVNPLLVLSGAEYDRLPFGRLHALLCDALRGPRLRVVAESWEPGGRVRLVFEDGTTRDLSGRDE